jgi:hypothetical protein
MSSAWPKLNYDNAKETYEALLYWTQIVGKIRLGKTPWINHSWHVPLYVTPKGLTTSDIGDKDIHFQIDFNFIDHKLEITTDKGTSRSFGLEGLCVADFYGNIFNALSELNIEAIIRPVPNEVMVAIPFPENTAGFRYDAEEIARFHKALLNANSIFTKFRAGFSGKCSPVHFFWGADDLAVTRFSGRRAPKHPGGVPNLPDRVAEEAYSHEVSSAGFWPGNAMFPQAAFYSYIYPEPPGFKEAQIQPSAAYYHKDMGEYILPYDAVQQSDDPEQMVLDFLHTTYSAAADLAGWDRKDLEVGY